MRILQVLLLIGLGPGRPASQLFAAAQASAPPAKGNGITAELAAEARAAARAGLMRVQTPQGLAAAMAQGVPHISIEAHLDLRSLPTLQSSTTRALFEVDPAIMSIRVRTSG